MGFHLVTATIFSNFKIQSKYDSGFQSEFGILAIRESLVCSHWDWWITCDAWAVTLCILWWLCNRPFSELSMVLILHSNCLCCWSHQSCLWHELVHIWSKPDMDSTMSKVEDTHSDMVRSNKGTIQAQVTSTSPLVRGKQ